tara:strand:- start:89 stop:262 length:174 start_codon:yes stop_codon:yes gene_type:complete
LSGNILNKIMKKKEYYTEELEKSNKDKLKALEFQKYYTAGSIILMILVLLAMYLVLN